MANDLEALLPVPFDVAVDRTKAALAKHGFGVLTDIDMEATLRAKIGVELRPYRILGACNPPLAHRAVLADPAVGLALPCNVVVDGEAENRVRVRAFDPNTFVQADSPAELRAVADEVRTKLAAAMADLTSVP